MKILITGINGFAGSHLTQYLRDLEGVEIAGLDLAPPRADSTGGAAGTAIPVHCCDLTDAGAVRAALEEERPDAIIHLAARAQVAGAWEEAAAIVSTNVGCTQALMQVVHDVVPEARVLLISSSEVYGTVSPDRPITESFPLKPNNPYSASKASQEYVALQYFFAFRATVVVARPFNHIGPGQVGNFVVPSFASQLAEMEAGRREAVLRVGNLESRRDFTDVRDIVRAYYLLLTRGEPGQAYNVCSGNSYRISDILQKLLELSTAGPRIENDPAQMRPSDAPVVVGDASRLKTLGDWEPAVPLEQSLKDALDYWRERVSARSSPI